MFTLPRPGDPQELEVSRWAREAVLPTHPAGVSRITGPDALPDLMLAPTSGAGRQWFAVPRI